MNSGAPRAAVAVLARGLGSGDPRVLLGKRREDPRDPWSGHLALPGGRRDESDGDLLDTAIRELQEEAGLAVDRTRACGPLPDVVAGRVTGRDTRVRPWLIEANPGDEPGFGDGEMVSWEWFPLRDLDRADLKVRVRPGEGWDLPGVRRPQGTLWGMTLNLLQSVWDGPLVDRSRWWLDYDGTMYPASHVLTEAVDRRITEWVASSRGIPWDEADALRTRLYRDHGNTLRGMMRESDADPHAYLDYVFDLPHDHMPLPDPRLETFLRATLQPVSVFTNARADYVARGLEAMGIRDLVGTIHDIESFGWSAKPDPGVYRSVLEREGVVGEVVAFVDDRVDNLVPARTLGMETILVDEGGRHAWREEGMTDVDALAPYGFKVRRAGDLLWLAHPRLGTDLVGESPSSGN
ncbi:MAG: HAD-IA family hydrolase [Fibrobacteria bacterium]|nr:HAD-IA family hydrolase [Fibrobacteria bacterium]